MAPQKRSAGLLLYRRKKGVLEVLLVHPGGPFWTEKDLGAWSVPKGEIQKGEEPLASARREFLEETGFNPEGTFVPLKPITQKSGKIVVCWAIEGDLDPAQVHSNTFKMEWPARSGRFREFPEVDRAAFFGLEEARQKINSAQARFLTELEALLATPEA